MKSSDGATEKTRAFVQRDDLDQDKLWILKCDYHGWEVTGPGDFGEPRFTGTFKQACSYVTFYLDKL